MPWLQGITLAWLQAECILSLYGAADARSPVLLAFGSDTGVEILSAGAVLLLAQRAVTERSAGRIAGALLFAVAFVVGVAAVTSLALRLRPDVSYLGMTIAAAALVIMPVLAALKNRESRRTGNIVLAADAIQSAACVFLALIALAGFAANALLHIAWFDSVAALAAIPLLLKEGREAWHGRLCNCG